MILQYAEVTLHRESTGWCLNKASHSFWGMTSFTPASLYARCQNQFLHMLAPSDIPSAEDFFATATMPNTVCPWIYSLLCADFSQSLSILLQIVQISDDRQHMLLRLHDASSLGEQIQRLDRRIFSLEQSIPSGLCQVQLDEHMSIIWYNDYFLEMLGYTDQQFSQELKGRATGYIHPEDLPILNEQMAELRNQGHQTLTLEMRVIRRGGGISHLLVSLSFTDETINGYPVLYSSGIDISAQHHAQQLELDAQRLRLAMEQSSTYILEYDVVSRRLMAAESLHKFFDFDGDLDNAPEALLRSGLVMPISEEDLMDMFHRVERGEERVEATVGLYDRKHGDAELWLQLRLSSIYNGDGQAARAILLAEDITARHHMEMRYRQEEKRRAAMTFGLDFSYQSNLSTGMVLSANEKKFPFLDFSSEVSCQTLSRLHATQKVHPDDRADYLRALSVENMLAQFNQGVPEFTMEFRSLDFLNEDDTTYHWYRGDVHIIREPVRGEIFAYTYTKDIDAEKRLELELRRHAEQDSLTGLLNRYTMEVHCNRHLSQLSGNQLGALFMMDLDNFKHLNDTFGHLQGDEMLCQVATCLQGTLGSNAVLGRLGGDELVAFQPLCPNAKSAMDTAQRLCDAVKDLSVGAGVATLSVGIAFSPRDGVSFTELYHHADAALYQAKRLGKNCWAVYDETMQKTAAPKDRFPVSREWLLEESSDIIYVCDFFSYDLLYMNAGARNTFGIGQNDYLGKKCYELLQNKDHPCEFCTNHLLCRDEFYTWEFRNTTVGKSLLLRDRIVDWYGVPARIEFATDVSAMDVRNQELSLQLEIDTTIISCLRIINNGSSLDLSSEKLLSHLASFHGADRAYILDYDPIENLLIPRYEWCIPGLRSLQQVFHGNGIHPDKHLRVCFDNHENSILEHPDLSGQNQTEYTRSLYDAGVLCQRGVPFYINGNPAGLIGVDNPTTYRDEMTVMETISYFVAEELSQSRLSARLTYLSYHDSLTGLSNRNRYVVHLEEQKYEDIQSLGVAVADLNALKDINKMRGHAAGDEVVRRTAQLLQESFPTGYIFRLSGDEFVIHCENLDRMVFLEQIKQLQERADVLQAHGISVGYAWTDGIIDCNMLMLQATDIMLMRKRQYYQEAVNLTTSGKRNAKALRELQEHMENGSYLLYLQPKASCDRFCLDGAEALVRFDSKETGFVPPDRFIPLLEQEHLIQYLDLYMFGQVCLLLSRWRLEGRPALTVSVNFSRQTLLEPDLLKKLIDLTDLHQVPRDQIEVEITESLGDYESATIAEIGAGIKSAGFRLALDDFGSHYTNMAMLATVPVDVLKLDRGLVCNVMYSHANQLVLKSILCLCRELNIASIAEGVETEAQLSLLRELQCDSIQGYLFGRPVSVEDFERKYLPVSS